MNEEFISLYLMWSFHCLYYTEHLIGSVLNICPTPSKVKVPRLQIYLATTFSFFISTPCFPASQQPKFPVSLSSLPLQSLQCRSLLLIAANPKRASRVLPDCLPALTLHRTCPWQAEKAPLCPRVAPRTRHAPLSVPSCLSQNRNKDPHRQQGWQHHASMVCQGAHAIFRTASPGSQLCGRLRGKVCL